MTPRYAHPLVDDLREVMESLETRHKKGAVTCGKCHPPKAYITRLAPSIEHHVGDTGLPANFSNRCPFAHEYLRLTKIPNGLFRRGSF